MMPACSREWRASRVGTPRCVRPAVDAWLAANGAWQPTYNRAIAAAVAGDHARCLDEVRSGLEFAASDAGGLGALQRYGALCAAQVGEVEQAMAWVADSDALHREPDVIVAVADAARRRRRRHQRRGAHRRSPARG